MSLSTTSRYILALIILTNQQLSCGFTVREVISKSKSAVETQSTSESNDLLEEHFFTKEKNSSIWNFAQNARNAITHQELKMKSAKFIENGLEKIQSEYKNCSESKELKFKVTCWTNLAKTLTRINIGMQVNESWSTEVNYGLYYNTYALMVYHIAVIATNDFKRSHGENVGKTVAEFTNNDQSESSGAFYQLIETINNLLEDIDLGIRTWRLIQITPLMVCDVTEVFWQMFYENCQPAEIKVPIIVKLLTQKDDDDKRNKNEIIVDKFGTKMKSGSKKYYFSVRDKVKDKFILEKYMVFEKNVKNFKKALSVFMDVVMSKKVRRERTVKKMLNAYSEIYYDSVNQIGDYLVNLVR